MPRGWGSSPSGIPGICSVGPSRALLSTALRSLKGSVNRSRSADAWGGAFDEGLDGDVGHRGVVGRAVPVLAPGWSPDHVDFGDAVLVAAPLLDPTVAGGDDQGLSAGVGVPGSACTRGEGHLGRTERADIIDVE